MPVQGEHGHTMVGCRDVIIVLRVPTTHQQVNRHVRRVAVVISVPVVLRVRRVRQRLNQGPQPPVVLRVCPVAVGRIIHMVPVHLTVFVLGIQVILRVRNICNRHNVITGHLVILIHCIRGVAQVIMRQPH